MRLIDADKLETIINDLMSSIKCADDDIAANTEGQTLYYVLNQIDQQPTAYDLDKVVEELEKCINESFDKCDFGISRATYKKALRIVKRGGTDETNNQN